MVRQFYLTLSGATTPGQTGYGRNDNERVLHISQSSRAGVSPSDYLVSYPEHLLGKWGRSPLRDAAGIWLG